MIDVIYISNHCAKNEHSIKNERWVRVTYNKTDFNLFDLDLWSQGHIGDRKYLLSSTRYKQQLFQIWTIFIENEKKSSRYEQ